MVHPARNQRRIAQGLALIAANLLVIASAAEARLETVRWTHSRSDAVDFEMLIEPVGGSSQVVALGRSGQSAGTEYVESVEVGDGDVELSLRAVGPGGVRSAWNSTILRIDLSPPPPPPTLEVEPGAGSAIPPTAGAAVRFDFASDAPGNSVNGWADTRANYSLVVDDSLFDVADVEGNQMLHTDSTQDAIHAHATADVRRNFEVRGRFAMNHPDASIGVTTYSGYPNADVYYRIGRSTGQSLRFDSRPGMVCANEDSGLTPNAGEWIRFELDVRDEGSYNRIVAKLWRANEAEPSSPQIDCVDNSGSRPNQGSIGVWAGGPGQKYWDDFELFQGVDSGGSNATAPLPPLLIQILPVEDS